MINLNKKDTQGVVPLCLLVMNMTPIERKVSKPDSTSQDRKEVSEKDFTKMAASMFTQDGS